MLKIIATILLIHSIALANAQYKTQPNKKGYYMNPLFAGDYPDPSILRDGNPFNSSMKNPMT
jgi:xylan 1,4-beta-xylosidase